MGTERFALGHAAGNDWRDVSESALDRLQPLPHGGNLGFMYLSDRFADATGDILARVRARTGIERWIGTTGVGICATGREYYDEPAVALLVGAYGESSFQLFDLDERSLHEFVANERGWLDSTAACFGIAHGDPLRPESVNLLSEFGEATNAFIVGGLTSSQSTYPHFAGDIARGALSGVLFSSEVAVATGLTQGCEPLGPVHKVTDCQRNIAVALDGEPALEVLKRDIGEVLARDLRRIAGYIFAAFPVEGSDQADYVVRNLTGIDLSQGLVAIGDMLVEGQRLMFCRRDRESARRDLERMLNEITARAGDQARGAIYCSCVARGPNMFEPPSGELDIIAEALGDLPLVGFFGNGEFSHNRLYTYTGVLTLFL
jgi:small ligand-binding sensory domain FIST